MKVWLLRPLCTFHYPEQIHNDERDTAVSHLWDFSKHSVKQWPFEVSKEKLQYYTLDQILCSKKLGTLAANAITLLQFS